MFKLPCCFPVESGIIEAVGVVELNGVITELMEEVVVDSEVDVGIGVVVVTTV